VESTINGDVGSITIANTYTITPSEFTLEGTKVLTGRTLNNREFSFKLYKSDYSFTSRTNIQTVANNATGKFVFSGLKEMPGTYYYVIEEVEGNLGGVTYDKSRYHVTVTIVDNGDGTTKVAKTEIVKVSVGDNTAPADSVIFNNTYQATDTDGIVIEGIKALTGRHLLEGEFVFELYDADGVLIQTAVNKNGKFAFESLLYETVGTYTYTVKERNLNAGGMTYDGTVFTVTVKVTDDKNGELVASIDSIKDANDRPVDKLQFNNIYEIITPASITIDGTKTFTGREWMDADEFTFKLYETDSSYVVDEAKALDTKKATKAQKSFSFNTITYNKEGIYYYVVKEIAGTDGIGISYDETFFNVEVTVVDEHDGTLDVTSKYYKDGTLVSSINFLNTYHVYEGAVAKATISGIKTLTTRAIKDGEFTFELYATASDYVIKPGVKPIQTVNDGVTFTFETIEYDKVGTYYYVVKEMRAGETKDGVTFDEKEHRLKVVVSDGGLGYLVSQIVVEDEEVITVNNTYEITPDKFNLTATKSLTGRQLKDKEFTFELYQAADETFVEKKLIQTVTNDANGNVTFKDLAEQPGTYYYVMKEKAGNLGGVTYDTNRYHFTVTIVDDEVGSTKVDRVVVEKVTNSGTSIVDKAEFNNTYVATDSIGLVLEGTKSLTGRDLVSGEFEFELYDENGNLLQSTVNRNGKFTFAELKYETTGTYNYTIKEKDTKLGGVTYDSTIYSVKVVVTDDEEGELVAKVESIKNAAGAKKETLAFVNKYHAEPYKVVFNGTKVLTGRQWKDTDRFTFELYEEGQDAVRLIDQAFATKENKEFAFKEIQLTDEGVYYYVVKEKVESLGGVTYDTTVYNIKVTLKDMLDGTFSCEQQILVNEQSAEDIVFNNTYAPAKTEDGKGITLSVKKSLIGRELNADEFNFDLFETDETFEVTGTAMQTKSNDATGAVVFDEIGYDTAGTYYYVVLEKQGSLGGVTYDETQYRVTVRVTDDTNGKLVAEVVSIVKNDKENTVVDNVTFENSYQPSPTPEGDGISITANKVFSGKTLKENEFLFSLYETDETYTTDSAALETVSNNANGEIAFTELLYEVAGSYYYVVKEEKGTTKNVIYDSSVYYIEVLVTDDLEGHLIAEVVSITKDGESVETVEFKNVYFVDTADTTNTTNWLVSMLISALGCLVALRFRRKTTR
ncbi:MAG: FctA domain-containing protein, partial [Erysipelotrichaceae bacterium]|nr:FctA domain-containing protein [Erysipelotrichaceae bacterium]